jgi:hypothetical protein
MSKAQLYITTAIHNVAGSWNGDNYDDPPPDRTPATITGQITQFRNLKIAVPRKGMRTASFDMALLSPELPQFYTTSDPHFEPYRNFLFIKWRGHIVFTGPILTKEIDFEGNRITFNASGQEARLEKNYFKIGDQAMDGTGAPGDLAYPFAQTGHIPINYHGVELALQAVNHEENTKIATTDPTIQYPAVVPLAIQMGTNHHTDFGHKITISRGQEIWRTLLDIGDRTDGFVLNFIPQDPTSGPPYYFTKVDVYGQFRTDVSTTVQFHYNTGLNNVRNLQPATGGDAITRANTVSSDKRFNVYSFYLTGEKKYGIWVDWEAVDYSIDLNSTRADGLAELGVVGDAILDAYGIPLVAMTIVLNRDDVSPAPTLFHWQEDFFVGDIVEVEGAKGPESVSGLYQIDQFRLEQEGDNSGQMREAIDVIPWSTADRGYKHTFEIARPDNSSPA